jgi:hypothetical protein
MRPEGSSKIRNSPSAGRLIAKWSHKIILTDPHEKIDMPRRLCLRGMSIFSPALAKGD